MACLDSGTCVALRNILCYVDLHVGPPVIHFEILVHFTTPWVDREFGEMSLIQNFLPEGRIFRDNETLPEPNCTIGVLSETRIFRILLRQPLLDGFDSLVPGLRHYQLIPQDRFYRDGIQHALRNNFQA
jgi:hypothetical protein